MASLIRRLVLALVLMVGASGARAADDFAIRDGDTVAFLGDSITAARGYTKIVEQYTLMRFPVRRVRFVNAGAGGDTASGAVSRLERDVFSQGATVVTVAFGINDIGWGTKGDDAHKKAYLDGLRTIIEQCKQRNVRVIVCSAAITDVPPDEAEHGYLQTMTDEGLALAKSLGAGTIDMQRGMREIQRRIVAANAGEKDKTKWTRLHAPDGVHPNDLGQLAMAFVMLKGLGAPEKVSAAVVDAAKTEAAVSAEGCAISKIEKRADGGVAFTRLDEALPMTLGVLGALNYRWMPIPDAINRYMLTVRGLAAGQYEVFAEGRSLGKMSAEQLAAGQNISAATGDGWQPGGPWDAQSNVVRELVDARNKLASARAERVRTLGNHPQQATLEREAQDVDDRLVALQRATARPYAYRFEVRRAEAGK